MSDFEDHKRKKDYDDFLRRLRDQDSMDAWQRKHDITESERTHRDATKAEEAKEKAEISAEATEEAARIRTRSAEDIADKKIKSDLELASMAEEHKIETIQLLHDLEPEKHDRLVSLEAQYETIRTQAYRIKEQADLYNGVYRKVIDAHLQVWIAKQLGALPNSGQASQAETDLSLGEELFKIMRPKDKGSDESE